MVTRQSDLTSWRFFLQIMCKFLLLDPFWLDLRMFRKMFLLSCLHICHFAILEETWLNLIHISQIYSIYIKTKKATKTMKHKSISRRQARAFQTQQCILIFIWSLPSPLKPCDAPIEKALFSYALSQHCFGMHLHSSPRVKRTAQTSLLLLYAARPSLFESFRLSWRWSIGCGTSVCMWTRYLWSAGKRSTNTHACTYTCTRCLDKTMSRHWRWYSCNNKHSWTRGGR